MNAKWRDSSVIEVRVENLGIHNGLDGFAEDEAANQFAAGQIEWNGKTGFNQKS
jgi:hypothetical protein